MKAGHGGGARRSRSAPARALATPYGRLLTGEILDAPVLARAVEPRSEGPDEVLLTPAGPDPRWTPLIEALYGLL
ncbi:hypothetical protein GCM10009530_11510 [Microbispora corallina]|uniref:Uncharacterized protein n=1 Tax=Microbispora corallina TaxID=83302 RepID=A0ABQ4FTK4_9ACTN|nr:hypothetical protein [Microbispora corallina]GIH38152.1 hypothetical protein Mco01_11520 [Microbispora corallina]